MSKARKDRTQQARTILAETHIIAPILGRIRSGLAVKSGTIRKTWEHGPIPQENADLLDQYAGDIAAIIRVQDLLKRMNERALEALRYDIRRDISAEIASMYTPSPDESDS